MYKNLCYLFLLPIFICFSSTLFSQAGLQQAIDYLRDNAAQFDVTEDVDWRVVDDFIDDANIYHARFLQTYQGIDVETQIVGVHIKDGEVFYTTGKFIGDIANVAASEETVATGTALQTALQNRDLTTSLPLTPISTSIEASKLSRFDLNDIALQEVTVQLIYTAPSEGEIRLAWEVDIYEKDANHWWRIQVDAATGAVLIVRDQVLECDFGAPDPHEYIQRLNKLDAMPCEEAEALIETGYLTYSAYGAMPHDHSAHEHHAHAAAVMSNTYRALPLGVESPSHGNFELLNDPAADNVIASPNGWHDDGNNTYTITRGNNVWAQEDQNGNNGTGFSPDGGSNLNFDWTFDPASDPETGDNLNAAVTNLFVWNNFMHDIFYNYGFTEVNANFQEDNFGRGGSGGDFVFADAQDGSGSNNANFATPADGGNPRMQMFLWTAPTTTVFTVNTPANIADDYTTVVAGFGAQSFSVTGDLVLVEDASNTNDACDPITNAAALVGNIALIDRGNCEFGTKVLAAENAGAIAVVVCNNVAGNPIPMGAGDDGGSVTIPSVMISQGDCATIRAEIPTVNVSISSSQAAFPLNGDFDNGIIAHEYGHGISNRMTSSTVGCLSNAEQMGEGWSDWWGLVLSVLPTQDANTPRGIGTYANGEPTDGPGIRPFPYTRDMNVNPVTYADVADASRFSQPHGIGSIWCSMIWDLYWDLVDEYGYDTDLYNGTGGNNIAINLVTQGCTYQGCRPGFADGRDGILAADQALYGGANECIIWEAFARRGLGFSADQGSSSNRSDGVEAFDLPPDLSCNTCGSDLKLDNNPVAGGTYASADSIVASGVIPANATVTFEAGELIRLTDGFVAENGSTFTARIQACTANANAPVVEERNEDAVVAANTAQAVVIYPNPFSEQTTVEVQVTETSDVQIELYTLAGRKITTIATARDLPVGTYQYTINADQLEGGMYLLTTRVGDRLMSKKLSLMK
ncbi:MAG: T9SS-dependent M36 family metallopeptidase [Bacteroidota bacterium]